MNFYSVSNKLLKKKCFFILFFIFLFWDIVQLQSAEHISTGPVIINEFAAAVSTFNLNWDEGRPRIGAGYLWQDVEFSDDHWQQAPAPFGMGYADLNTQLEITGAATSIYFRKTIDVSDEVASNPVSVSISYDDSFVMYINGVEVARKALGPKGGFVYHNQVSLLAHTMDWVDHFQFDSALVPGRNVIAIQVCNASIKDTQMGLRFSMTSLAKNKQDIIRENDVWKYFVGITEPAGGLSDPPEYESGVHSLFWTRLGYDFSRWRVGPEPFGYGSMAATDLEFEMKHIASTLYLRKDIDISEENLSTLGELKLSAFYNAAFVLYINGKQIIRSDGISGILGDVVEFNTVSYVDHDINAQEIFTLGNAQDLLRSGTNVIGIQILNSSIASEDFLFTASLFDENNTLIGQSDTWSYFVGTREPIDCGGDGDRYAISADLLNWIELYNTSDEPISLKGWSLSNKPTTPNQWVFPDISIGPKAYMIVFASEEDRIDPRKPLHTNFRLSASSGFIGLYDTTRSPVSTIMYPEQSYHHSYARIGDGWDYRYMPIPTPGRENIGATLEKKIAPPQISHPGGVINEPIQISVTAEDDEVIIYSLDGSLPLPGQNMQLFGPIDISKNTTVRARALKEGCIPSEIITMSYLFDMPLDEGIPVVDVNDEDVPLIKQLPVISIVGDWEKSIDAPYGTFAVHGGYWHPNNLPGDWWWAVELDDYNNVTKHGRAFERNINMEYFDINGDGINIQCGFRPARSDMHRAKYQPKRGEWKEFPYKWSSRVYFRRDYGTSSVDYPFFNDIGPGPAKSKVLAIRTGSADGIENPFTRDEFSRRIHLDMGQPASRGKIVNLFINGEYKSYFNLIERIDEKYFEQRYGGSWDVIKREIFLEGSLPDNSVVDGDLQAWDTLMGVALSKDLSDNRVYEWMRAHMDMESFIDFLLVNIYVAHIDWPWNNWIAARQRTPEGKFVFYNWDQDATFDISQYDNILQLRLESLDDITPISELYRALKKNSNFRMLFIDRIQKHFLDGGPNAVFSPQNLMKIWNSLRHDVEPMIAYQHHGQAYDNFIGDQWIPTRHETVLTQLREANLWPLIPAPVFRTPGGIIQSDMLISFDDVPSIGTIYYTLDGSDPRTPSDSISSSSLQYNAAFTLVSSATIRARIFDGLTWGPIAENKYDVEAAGVQPGDIIISEFLADPHGNDDGKEWIELYNVTKTDIDIQGWILKDNEKDYHVIGDTATDPIVIPAKGYLVLGESKDKTVNGGIEIDYEFGYEGMTLGNSADEIILKNGDMVIYSVGYGSGCVTRPDVLMNFAPGPKKGKSLGMAKDYRSGAVEEWINQTTVIYQVLDADDKTGEFVLKDITGTPGKLNDGIDSGQPENLAHIWAWFE